MPSTSKIDLFKQHKADYAAPRTPQYVTPEAAAYLAIRGKGGPSGEEFQAGVAALYGIAYGLKFGRKKAGLGPDYGVCKLEALYWGKSKTGDFSRLPKSEWNWKLLIRTPDFIDADEIAETARALIDKGKDPLVTRVKLETLDEGDCVQQLHVGPFDQVGATIESMRALVEDDGRRFAGTYHEIYLSDPRRVAPEKLKTIVRIPVR